MGSGLNLWSDLTGQWQRNFSTIDFWLWATVLCRNAPAWLLGTEPQGTPCTGFDPKHRIFFFKVKILVNENWFMKHLAWLEINCFYWKHIPEGQLVFLSVRLCLSSYVFVHVYLCIHTCVRMHRSQSLLSHIFLCLVCWGMVSHWTWSSD